jgi:hypothetical protein
MMEDIKPTSGLPLARLTLGKQEFSGKVRAATNVFSSYKFY